MKTLNEWQKVFAWLPVSISTCGSRKTVWLRPVYRMYTEHGYAVWVVYKEYE